MLLYYLLIASNRPEEIGIKFYLFFAAAKNVTLANGEDQCSPWRMARINARHGEWRGSMLAMANGEDLFSPSGKFRGDAPNRGSSCAALENLFVIVVGTPQ